MISRTLLMKHQQSHQCNSMEVIIVVGWLISHYDFKFHIESFVCYEQGLDLEMANSNISQRLWDQ